MGGDSTLLVVLVHCEHANLTDACLEFLAEDTSYDLEGCIWVEIIGFDKLAQEALLEEVRIGFKQVPPSSSLFLSLSQNLMILSTIDNLDCKNELILGYQLLYVSRSGPLVRPEGALAVSDGVVEVAGCLGVGVVDHGAEGFGEGAGIRGVVTQQLLHLSRSDQVYSLEGFEGLISDRLGIRTIPAHLLESSLAPRLKVYLKFVVLILGASGMRGTLPSWSIEI